MRILVAGGTGGVGRRVVARAAERGDAVVVLSRDPQRARQVLGHTIEVRTADVRAPDTLRAVGEGCDAAVLALGSRSYYGSNGVLAVEVAGTRALCAALTGVPHVVLVSAFGLDRSSLFLRLFSRVLNGYFPAKAAAEQAVRASGIPWTIVRPVEFTNRPPRGGPRLTQDAPLSLLRLVSRDTVADVALACAGNSAAFDRTFELSEGSIEPIDDQLRRLLPEAVRPRPSRTPLW